MNFIIESKASYNQRQPVYFPREIGCFSMDTENKYLNDKRQMKYLSMPNTMPLVMDLNKGYDEHIHYTEIADCGYHALLDWINSHQNIIREHFTDSNSLKIDFVLTRGILTTISATVYNKSGNWTIYATKLKSVIYLCNAETPKESTVQRRPEICWGFKFEQYMVSESKDSKPDTSVPVNENEKYYAIFKGNLGHHRLLLHAEIDCVDQNSTSQSYVELKTCRQNLTYAERMSFCGSKLLLWYLKCYFAGIPKVICGFRNKNGIVKEIKSYNVKEMPTLAENRWSPNICLNFCSKFLDHVKKSVVKDEVVYKFDWKKDSDRITCEEIKLENTFLPADYLIKLTAF